MLNIKIKRLHPEAKIPQYAKEGDAGMDITATTKKEDEEGRYIEYGTGLAFEIPEDYVILVFPRSSLSKKDLIQANHVGVLDSGYRGELKIRLKKFPNKETANEIYKVGDRIAQIMPLPIPKVNFEEVEELSKSSRGTSGLGSTGD